MLIYFFKALALFGNDCLYEVAWVRYFLEFLAVSVAISLFFSGFLSQRNLGILTLKVTGASISRNLFINPSFWSIFPQVVLPLIQSLMMLRTWYSNYFPCFIPLPLVKNSAKFMHVSGRNLISQNTGEVSTGQLLQPLKNSV